MRIMPSPALDGAGRDAAGILAEARHLVDPVLRAAVDTLPGFHIATGFTGHGFGIGPGAGRLMAEIVTGEAPVVDPTPFRYSRFTDGSRPQPSPLA